MRQRQHEANDRAAAVLQRSRAGGTSWFIPTADPDDDTEELATGVADVNIGAAVPLPPDADVCDALVAEEDVDEKEGINTGWYPRNPNLPMP